jgi:hypothetical protein
MPSTQTVSKSPAKTSRKTPSQSPRSSAAPAAKKASAPAKPVAKAPKTAVKPASGKPTAKAPTTAPAKAPNKAPNKAPTKAPKDKKVKVVRDSFTIPKTELLQVGELKKRALTLGVAAKKSELIRAGLFTLASMNDAALKKAMANVPTIKTGRPAKD